MDTQNTPLHIHLWNRGFWLLMLANLLLSMGTYIQMSLLVAMAHDWGVGRDMVAWTLGAFALGLPALGAVVSFWIEHYRRNMVCIWAVLGLAVCLAAPAFINLLPVVDRGWALVVIRLMTGMAFGLAQMVLSSTLVIDMCEAPQRTEANYATTWFGRFAIALGPFVALVLMPYCGAERLAWLSAALAVVAVILIRCVYFPFRTPDDNVSVISLDRFFLPKAWVLFLNLIFVTVALGMMMASECDTQTFFAGLMVGFMLAVIAESHVFANAELMSDTISGLLLMSFGIMLMVSGTQLTAFTGPTLIGLGVGLVGARFLLLFIKLSRHCQRGTAQSSFLLAWEMGIAVGWWAGYGSWLPDLMDGQPQEGEKYVMMAALCLVVLALFMYVTFTHRWYIRHKNR
jgi:MFS family permease